MRGNIIRYELHVGSGNRKREMQKRVWQHASTIRVRHENKVWGENYSPTIQATHRTPAHPEHRLKLMQNQQKKGAGASKYIQ